MRGKNYTIGPVRSRESPRDPKRKRKGGSVGVSKNAVAGRKSSCIRRLYNLSKGRNQCLCQPEAEDQLGAGHQELRGQTLEETEGTLVLDHVRHNSEARLRVLKVAVLDAGLDHIQGCGHDQRSTSSAHRGHKVLGPAGRVVVLQIVDVFLGKSRSTEELAQGMSEQVPPQGKLGSNTYREGTGGISGGRPTSAPVQTHALIGNDLEQTTATEGLGVSLTLNLEDVQREKDDLSNTNQTKHSQSIDYFHRPISTRKRTCQQKRA